MEAVTESRSLLRQFHYLDFANGHYASRVVVLEGKMTFLEEQIKVEKLVQLIAIYRHLDPCKWSVTPNIVTDLNLVGEPHVRFD